MSKKGNNVKLSSKYRLPDNPQVRIFDILQFVNTLDGALFDSATIAGMFHLTIHDACVRLGKLKSWGMIKAVKRSRPMFYTVTDWGRKFLKDQRETMVAP